MLASALLDQLNESQRAAATHAGGHALVLAGAGSGKTRTIIARAAYLIDSGVSADRVQILTFTRKSASEIVERVRMVLGDGAERLSACTFHSWCMHLIRRMPGMFGCVDHSVIDRDDQLGLFRMIRGRRGETSLPPAAQLCQVYSFARNCRIPLLQSLKHFDEELLAAKDELAAAFSAYEARKKDRRYLDYDDVLDVVATVLGNDIDVREFVASRYDHILVDEMQDTNPLQWQLLDSLRGEVQLYCVGDDAQSIYGFRGADFRNVHSFSARVPGGTVLKLEQNYRSTAEILDLANWLLRQSPLGYGKELIAMRGPGTKPRLIEMESEWDEGRWIADDILKRRADGADWTEQMILIRSRFAGRAVEVALLERKIPFVFIGGTSLMQSAHVRDVLALLRLVANPRDEIAWERYLTLWPRVGEKTASDLVDRLIRAENIEVCIEIVRGEPRVPPAAWKAIQRVGHRSNAPAEAFNVATTDLREVLKANYSGQNWESRLRDFPLVEQLAAGHQTLLGFIEQYILDPMHFSELERSQGDDRVTLITIHSAKGTECPVCYVVGVSPGAYPHFKSLGNKDEVEEERRVLYVAMTRAREELILTRPRLSTFAAEGDPTSAQGDGSIETYFLNDLPEELVDRSLTTRPAPPPSIFSVERAKPDIGIDLGPLKPDLGLAEDTCSSCGEEITARATIHFHELQKFCTKCYNEVTRRGRPATENQLQYICKMGLASAPQMTAEEASEIISAAADIQQYLHLLANQIWPGLDLSGINLFPIATTIHSDRAAREEALSTYTRITVDAFAKQAMVDKQNAGDPNYEQPHFGHFIAPIPRTRNSSLAVLLLAIALDKVTVDPGPPLRCTVPVEQQAVLLGWLSDLSAEGAG